MLDAVAKAFLAEPIPAELTQARNGARTAARPGAEARLREAARKEQGRRADDLRRAVARARAEAELADGRLREVQTRLKAAGVYRLDLENAKRSIAQAEKLSAQFAEEIERLKLELGSPARVTLGEEPAVRRVR